MSVATDDLQRLARAGRPWDFLPRALAELPARSGLAEPIAENLIALGLRTPAAEVLDQSGTDAPALRARLSSMRDDRFPLEARRQLLLQNLRRVQRESAGADLQPLAARWLADEAAWDVLATNTGSVIRRPAGSLDPRGWLWFAEQRTAARAFAEQHFASQDPDDIGPVTVEGVNPPWILAEIARATPASPTGHRPLLRIVQRDAAELFEGLSLLDLDAALGDRRARWYVGEDAGDHLAQELADHAELRTTGPSTSISTLRAAAQPSVSGVIESAGAAQQAELAELRARVERDRDAKYWAARFGRALAEDSPEPLRVLIPSCRYTTYVQHAAEGLAQTCRDLGWQAEILIEPDDASHLSAIAYWRAAERFDPDLIMPVNHPRATRPEAFPRDVPFVCWIQDRMMHLYDRAIGEAQTSLDFVCGQLTPAMFGSYRYPRERAIAVPVLPNEAVFDAPTEPADTDRFACDIACVTHHSETPDAMHERLVAEGAAGDPRFGAALAAMRPAVEHALDQITREPSTPGLLAAARDALGRAGLPNTAQAPSRLIEHYARPLLERMVRHRTLAWTAAICARRGWKLGLYGRGWDGHPSLASHALGEVAHGGDLRACYAGARCHLHIATTSLVHQRVMECALSGGLPIVQLTHTNLSDPIHALSRDGVRESQAVDSDERGAWFSIDSSPTLAAEASARERIGLPVDTRVRVPKSRLPELISPSRRLAPGPTDLLGDLADIGFIDERTLEARLERAIGDEAWRRDRSASIAERVRASASQRSFASELVGFVHASLAG